MTTLATSHICPVLVGRNAQIKILAELIEQLSDPAVSERIVLISGEAGIGKSRLMAEAEAHASNRGFTILRGRCFEPDRMLPNVDLGRIHQGQRHYDEADQHWAAARAVIQKLAATLPDRDLRETFLRETDKLIPPPSASRTAKRSFGGLTKREREVAALIAKGKSNREVAEQLVVSERTIEKHVESILMKLGFNSRSQVAVWMVSMRSTENSERGQDSV